MRQNLADRASFNLLRFFGHKNSLADFRILLKWRNLNFTLTGSSRSLEDEQVRIDKVLEENYMLGAWGGVPVFAEEA